MTSAKPHVLRQTWIARPHRRAAFTPARRRTAPVLHVVGIVLALGSTGMIAAAIVEAIDGGPDVATLASCGVVVGGIGVALWRTTTLPDRFRAVEVFLVVTASWLALSIAGALPYVLTGAVERVDDALFESVSGLTTTGATVLRPIEDTSAGVLFWRSVSQWFGGMGVIVLVVAVLPVIGRGMDLLRAEAPGPSGERLTPRVRDTARRLWGVYVGFTGALIVAYAVAGMSAYDAVTHTFTTVSTGGFSPYSRSIAHFDSAAIEWIAVIAMLLAGGSFALYYRALRRQWRPLWRSTEVHVYVGIVVVASAIALIANQDDAGLGHDAVRGAAFNVTSVVSTTGYATQDFGGWAQAAQVVLLLLMPLGGMAGSTAGGIKTLRLCAISSYATRAARRQLHPRLVRPIRVGETTLDEETASRVMGFLVFALAILTAATMLVAVSGADLVTSFSTAATTFGNVGPGLGDVGPSADFLAVSPLARWTAMLSMLLGRLEIFPVLLALAALPRPRLRRRDR